MNVTIGNRPADGDHASVYNLSETGVLTHEFDLDEQGSNDIHFHSTGEVVVVGTDPTEGWDFGNIYVKESGVWSKKRTLTNTIHTWGACEHKGRLYVATGGHIGDNTTFVGQVLWSNDFGDTWEGSADVTSYRVFDVIDYDGKLYATGNNLSLAQALYTSTDFGVTWSLFAGVTPRQRHRMFEFGGNLMVVDYSRDKIIIINSSLAITELQTPKTIANNYNVIATVGTDLFILCGTSEDQVYRYDGTDWHWHCDLGERCVSLLNFEDLFLTASTVGVNADILKVPLQ